MVPATIQRVARLGDGWIVTGRYLVQQPDDQARQQRDRLYEALQAADRPLDTVDVYGAMSIASMPETEWAARADAWREFGATRFVIDTQGAGLTSPAEQIQVLSRIKEVVGLE